MIEKRWKVWTAAGAALMVGGGLAACGPRAEQAEAPATQTAPVGEGGEAAIGETGGEAGEAGAADAYAGLEGAERAALRLQHLKGFLLLSDRLLREGEPQAAAILVQQGLLEIADPAPQDLGGLYLAPLRTAVTGDAAALTRAIRATLKNIDAAQSDLGGVTAQTVSRMLALTRGLYSEVAAHGGIDPTEYQHSLGAALGAADALDRLQGDTAAPGAEMDRLLALWPAAIAPNDVTPAADVLAQTSRVELALAGM